MPLDIELRGTKLEREYMKKVFFPYENDERSVYLDTIVLGIKGLQDNYVGVIIEPLQLLPNSRTIYNRCELESVREDYIEDIVNAKQIRSNPVFAMYPKEGKIIFHNSHKKTKALLADETGIVFGYNLDAQRFLIKPFILKLFYHPKSD